MDLVGIWENFPRLLNHVESHGVVAANSGHGVAVVPTPRLRCDDVEEHVLVADLSGSPAINLPFTIERLTVVEDNCVVGEGVLDSAHPQVLQRIGGDLLCRNGRLCVGWAAHCFSYCFGLIVVKV
jgi:hypothetical protein